MTPTTPQLVFANSKIQERSLQISLSSFLERC
jgi:hypothetical protein